MTSLHVILLCYWISRNCRAFHCPVSASNAQALGLFPPGPKGTDLLPKGVLALASSHRGGWRPYGKGLTLYVAIQHIQNISKKRYSNHKIQIHFLLNQAHSSLTLTENVTCLL